MVLGLTIMVQQEPQILGEVVEEEEELIPHLTQLLGAEPMADPV